MATITATDYASFSLTNSTFSRNLMYRGIHSSDLYLKESRVEALVKNNVFRDSTSHSLVDVLSGSLIFEGNLVTDIRAKLPETTDLFFLLI